MSSPGSQTFGLSTLTESLDTWINGSDNLTSALGSQNDRLDTLTRCLNMNAQELRKFTKKKSSY